ncbi:hypothetical protein TEHAL1_17060 [Tetragenococcus halophilus]|uniref:helix-turn-helix domain-containing protein n=1 Tax=Tetragenococcus halophilus TaxID=51669 RepID=UPI0025627FFD|nr:helix-turn-helix transcriptional regulator [Tetragenococcus halophilus]GMG64231.1 hypothetical protein TEHAL1_17060 [Tetragenococcus halophilus]GMG68664.1 hypothetical protein TEHMS4_16000 [Tetragenococcus halophilus]
MDVQKVQDNIKKVRTAKGVTQRALANYLGITEMSYSRLENQNERVDSIQLYKIAKFLNVDLDIFFNEKLTESVVYNLKIKPKKEGVS